jgi:hypothetical protein
MRWYSAFHRRPACLVALVALAVVVYGLSMLWNEMKPNCAAVVLDRLPSPDGAWFAINKEFVCEMVDSDIGGGVHLVTTKPPFREIPLLVVDVGGYADQQRPHIAWSAPHVLRITVPLHSLLHIMTRQAEGVRVDIHFDPDDPAARAAWPKAD